MLLSAELVGPKIYGFSSSVTSCLCSKGKVH